MVNKHIRKDALHHRPLEELPIKIRRLRYTTTRMAKPKQITLPNSGNDMEQQKLSFTADGNTKWYSHFGRQFSNFLQN